MELTKESIKTVSNQTFKDRSYFFRNLLIFCFIAFAVLTYFVKSNPYFPFDLKITLFIQRFNYFWFDFLMRFMTEIGYFFWGSVMVSLFSLLLFYFRGKKDAAFLIFSSLGALVLSEVLKNIVLRPRPDPLLILQVETFKRADSFPSGHVLFAIGLYGFLLFIVYSWIKNLWLRRIVMALFLLIIILMGLSRIYLGSHWFSDTLGAYLIGFVWLYLVILAYRYSNPKK